MKKFRMLWALVQPMLAAAGITKPSDVGKVVKPLIQILEDLRTLEVQQTKELVKLNQSMAELKSREVAVEKDALHAAAIRSRLEELLD